MFRKGQVFTGDLLVGIMIFLIAFGGIVVFLYYSETKVALPNLIDDGKLVSRTVTGAGGVGVRGEEGEIDLNKLRDLGEDNYTELKNDLGVRSDFCVFFLDLEGKMVDVGGKYTIGSNGTEINVSGFKCGER
ncbi:MAG: hypothetical protein U9R08_07210 [Nanoarchaeota archaeon]|nr:hypothetical protein [Nanoarchaeota archaeon]